MVGGPSALDSRRRELRGRVHGGSRRDPAPGFVPRHDPRHHRVSRGRRRAEARLDQEPGLARKDTRAHQLRRDRPRAASGGHGPPGVPESVRPDRVRAFLRRPPRHAAPALSR